MINYLITGGCGFVGSNYINYIFFKDSNCNIINIDAMYYCANHNNVLKEIRNSNRYNFYKGSVCNYSLLENILKENNITHIIHFAAQSHVDNSFNQSLQYTNDNVIGTHTLLEVIKNINKSIILLHFSTDEVYGESNLYESEKTENSLLCPTNPYAASKAAAEMFVNSYIHSFGLKIIISRGNNIYGNNQYPEKLIPKFIKLLKENQKCTIQGQGNTIRNFIHIDDVCEAVYTILKKGTFGEIYNIGNDMSGEYSVLEIAKKLIKKIKNTDNFENYIEYIKDRPFNDQRYFISNDKIKNLGWKIKKEINIELDNLINIFDKNKTKNFGFIILCKSKDNIINLITEIRKYSDCKIVLVFSELNNKIKDTITNYKNIIFFNDNIIFYNPLKLYYYFISEKFFDKGIFIDNNINNDLIKYIFKNLNNQYLNLKEKKNNVSSTQEYNIFYNFINNCNLSQDEKINIILNYKNYKNYNGSTNLYSICDYNLINLIQKKFNLFKFLKNLDYENLSYLENYFDFLLSFHLNQ